MKNNFYIFIRTYLLLVSGSIIQKLLFMWYYHGYSQTQYLQVMLTDCHLVCPFFSNICLSFLLCCKLFLCGCFHTLPG